MACEKKVVAEAIATSSKNNSKYVSDENTVLDTVLLVHNFPVWKRKKKNSLHFFISAAYFLIETESNKRNRLRIPLDRYWVAANTHTPETQCITHFSSVTIEWNGGSSSRAKTDSRLHVLPKAIYFPHFFEISWQNGSWLHVSFWMKPSFDVYHNW